MAVDDELIGRVIAGKLLVREVLGRGAMGVVYRATHQTLGKDVAVKVMHRDLTRDRRAAGRFQREARAASRLEHPSSVHILDFGEDDGGLLYLAMELLEGRTLHDVIEESSPLPGPRIVDIATQALSALAVAHEMGVLHRDLKPENIMILQRRGDTGRAQDVVKVCDFGIAKLVEDDDEMHPPLTREGTIIGTPAYMSPEQGRGERLDARSDIYSMGVILFHMLTRRVPFQASNAVATIYAHIHRAPPDPRELAPAADPHLCSVCLRALAKDPAQRYSSARTMLADLRGDSVSTSAQTLEMPPDVAREIIASAPASQTESNPSADPPRRRSRLLRLLSMGLRVSIVLFVLVVAFTLFAKAMGWPVRGKWVQIKVVDQPGWAPPSPSAPASARP